MARQVNLNRGFLVDFSCERECTPSVVHIITSHRYIYLVYFQPPDATNDSSHRRAESTTVHQDSRRRFLNPSAPVPHVKMTKCARLTRSACAQTTAVNSAQTQVSQNTEFCKTCENSLDRSIAPHRLRVLFLSSRLCMHSGRNQAYTVWNQLILDELALPYQRDKLIFYQCVRRVKPSRAK